MSDYPKWTVTVQARDSVEVYEVLGMPELNVAERDFLTFIVRNTAPGDPPLRHISAVFRRDAILAICSHQYTDEESR